VISSIDGEGVPGWNFSDLDFFLFGNASGSSLGGSLRLHASGVRAAFDGKELCISSSDSLNGFVRKGVD
jgi:hypothetical protein